MNDLIFCLNVTIPVFLTMILGMIFRYLHIFTDEFVKRMNAFVFSCALPVLLFNDLSRVDFFSVWDTRFVLFCFFATLISIIFSYLVSTRLHNKAIQGEFVQASYRSSAAILGIALIENIYGHSTIAPLMIFASLPLYNVMAVIVLSVLKRERTKMGKEVLIKTIKGIASNPIILGIIAGFLWSISGIKQPVIMQKTLNNLSVLATPLGLMAMGASFQLQNAKGLWKPAILCTFIKLIVFVAIFLPIAIWMGFTSEKLVAILIMLGSATTVSCFIMAKNMGHDGTLSSTVVMLTTLCSAFTLTMWLFILKTLSYI